MVKFWASLKIQFSNGTTRHSTRLSENNDNQVVGYKPYQRRHIYSNSIAIRMRTPAQV